MHLSGHNIGNFAFWYATDKIVGGTKISIPFGAKPEQYAGEIDRFLIPAANFLNEFGDLGWLAGFIEALDIPCVIVGLGAQDEHSNSVPRISEGTQRFLHAVARRTPYIGVRGEFSRTVCKHYGVENVEVMGCPSILMSSNKKLGETVEAKWYGEKRRIAVHAACIKGNARNVERRLFEYMDLYPGSAYVLQRPIEFIKVVFGESLTESDLAYLHRSAPFLSPDLSYQQFLDKLSRHAYVPFSIDAWIAYLRHFSHAVGTRIHGSILSLCSEIPAVCIYHDSRTKELCDTLKMPAISVTEFRTDRNCIKNLFDYVAIKGKAFDENRLRLADRNRILLDEAGFPVSKHLLNLAQ